MALTESEALRIIKIEEKLNEIQTAINNLASRKQMKQILNLRQSEIDELKSRVAALESQVSILQEG